MIATRYRVWGSPLASGRARGAPGLAPTRLERLPAGRDRIFAVTPFPYDGLVTVHAHATAYGPSALRQTGRLVAAVQRHDPLAPVTVLVPSNYVGVTVRRTLARAGRGLAAVRFATVYRLAELLGGPRLAGAGRRPVSTPVLAAAVRAGLAHQPGAFRPVAEHPATEEALVRVHRELRDLSPAALSGLQAAGGRAGDVVRVHRGVVRTLEGGWYDEADLLDAATDVVLGGSPLVAELGTVLVHLPQEVGRRATALLAALASVTDVHLVAGLVGDERADEPVRALAAALGAPLPGEVPPAPVPGLRVVTTSDADEEARAAVRCVIDAARHGVALERIAVCYAAEQPYARLLAEHLEAAGIPRNGSATLALRERVAARALLGLLDLHADDLSRGRVLALVAGLPLRTGKGTPPPAARWERLSREAGVVRGRAQWDERLRRLASTRRAQWEQAEHDDTVTPGRRQHWHDDADAASELRDFVLDLADRCDPHRVERSWQALSAWAAGLLEHYLRLPAAAASWPPAEAAAAERVDAALARLAGLDAVQPRPTPAAFRRTLELELDADLGRVGRLGEGVFCGPVSLALGQDLDEIVVVGLAEGTFPGPATDDALLPDRDRARAGGELPLASARVDCQHRHLLAALASAHRAVLFVPRGDLRRSATRLASRWVLDEAGRRCGERVRSDDLPRRPEAWIEVVPSFHGGLGAVEFPATEAEHDLRTLLTVRREDGDVAAHPVAAHPALRRALALERARRGAAFTPFDGNLAGHAVPSPFAGGAAVAPTSLEAYVACPHAYLFQHVLRVTPVENPEDVVEIEPVARGNLVHEVLDRFLQSLIARPGGPPAPDQPWSDDDMGLALAEFDLAADAAEAAGLTGHPVFWRRDRRQLRDELEAFLRRHDGTRRAALRARPVAIELAFGRPGDAVPPVAVALPDGRTVLFRGRADRIDRCDDGTLVAIDYKTGNDRSYARLRDDPVAQGSRLQLPVYALAARAWAGDAQAPVRAEYRFVGAKSQFRVHGYEVTDAVLAALGRVLDVVATGIDAGCFPARPRHPNQEYAVSCRFCNPDGLGTGGRWREWERKKGAPELAAYVALVEGAAP